jgi:hypothetical protein
MISTIVTAMVLLGSGVSHKKHSALGTIVLNGEKVQVNWTDGDSFKIKEGKFKGAGTRLQGFNTLEAYGPVHRWGRRTSCSSSPKAAPPTPR